MLLECPNCREPVSFWRSIRTTAWGRYPCKLCGSILGVSFPHRMMALLPWVGLLGVFFGLLKWHTMGMHVYLPVMVGTLLLCFYFFEKVVLIERRAFTCKQCGYDLHGLTESRCPECGTKFDPAEKQRVLERIGQPPPKSRHLWIILLLLVILTAGVVANLVVYSRNRARPAPPPAPVSQPSPTTKG